MARSFNGTSDIITTPRIATPITVNFSIFAWINCTDFVAERGIFQNGNTNVNGYGLSVRQTTGLLSFPKDGLGFGDSSFTLTTGLWTPVGLTYVPAGSGTANFYANGALASSFNFTSAPLTPTTQCTIGRIEPNFFFKGGIADVAIWNVVLSSQEMTQLARGVRPLQVRPQNLVGYWPLDGYIGAAIDLSFNANRGALTGTTFIPGPPLVPALPQYQLPLTVYTTPPPPPPLTLMPQILT